MSDRQVTLRIAGDADPAQVRLLRLRHEAERLERVVDRLDRRMQALGWYAREGYSGKSTFHRGWRAGLALGLTLGRLRSIMRRG